MAPLSDWSRAYIRMLALADWLAVCGALLISLGLGLYSFPAGVVSLGVALVAAAVILSRS